MHPHVLVATLPVELQANLCACLRQRRILRYQVANRAAFRVAGVDDGDFTGIPGEASRVSRLAAA